MSLLFSHPIKKLTLAAAFGIGYTLGAKAGRERYEQIKNTAQQVKDDPRVQQAASQAEGFVRETASKVTDDPRVKDVVNKVEDVTQNVSDDPAGAAKHVAEKAEDATKQAADQAAEKVENVARHATEKNDGGSTGGGVNPLLADEHVATDDTVVYSAGPDIEETVDQLAPKGDADRI